MTYFLRYVITSEGGIAMIRPQRFPLNLALQREIIDSI